MIKRFATLGLSALVLLLIGCTQASIPTPTPSESSPEQSETKPDSTEGGESEGVSPEPCDSQTQSAIELTVNAQTQAFAQQNYELAYSYASPEFRSNVSLDGFVAIIASSYGPLIESSQLNFRDCVMSKDAGLALIDVRFLQGGNDVYALRYFMIKSGESWKVEGASNLEVVGKGT